MGSVLDSIHGQNGSDLSSLFPLPLACGEHPRTGEKKLFSTAPEIIWAHVADAHVRRYGASFRKRRGQTNLGEGLMVKEVRLDVIGLVIGSI